MDFFDFPRIFLLLLSILTVIAEDFSNGWGDGIAWRSYEDGIKESQELQKPLMLVIHKSWCGACKALKPQFAKSEEINELSTDFVMVNTLDEDEPQDEKYRPDGGYIPRILFMDPDGAVQEEIYNESGNPKYKYYYHATVPIVASMKKATTELASGRVPTEEL